MWGVIGVEVGWMRVTADRRLSGEAGLLRGLLSRLELDVLEDTRPCALGMEPPFFFDAISSGRTHTAKGGHGLAEGGLLVREVLFWKTGNRAA